MYEVLLSDLTASSRNQAFTFDCDRVYDDLNFIATFSTHHLPRISQLLIVASGESVSC